MLTDISNINAKLSNAQQNQNDLKGYLNKAFQTMKIQVRALKRQNQLLKSHHQQEIIDYKQQVSNLKKKIANFSQKQIIKVLMNAEDNQETKKQLNQLKTKHSQNCEIIRALKVQNEALRKKLYELQQQSRTLKESIQNIKYQKQKHLQLSIMQKIQIEEMNSVLERDIKSKANIISNLKNQIDKITKKEVDLTQQQRRLKKKAQQIKEYEVQIKNVSKFNKQKIQSKLQTVIKENEFLKNHIKKLQQNSVVQCNCSNQLENVKNKYISKSRQLSKTKMNLSKQLFKENMNAKLRQNLKNNYEPSGEEEQILFKLTQNSDSQEKQRENKFGRNYKKVVKN